MENNKKKPIINSKDIDNSNDIRNIQLGLREHTISRINHLKDLTGMKSETNIISGSVQFTEQVLEKVVGNKAKVFIENPDGTKEEITFKLK